MKKNKSIWVIRILLLLGTLVSLYFVPWPIVTAWIKPLPDTVQEQVKVAADYGFDGIIVYVDIKGEPALTYTSGYKNTTAKTPADPNALFKIASVDKLYTAVAIAKLTYDQHLDLDQSLAVYFPELKGRIQHADRITLRMMLQHRSGIPNFTDTQNYWLKSNLSAQENLELILDTPASFAPGTDYQYSNTNYLLLAQLIEKVTGVSRFQYIKQEILEPLDLQNTYGDLADVDLDQVMSGYYVGYPQDLKATRQGAMLATAQDLGSFIRALNEGTVFKNDKEQAIYSSIYKYGHTGLIPGYQTIAKYHADIDAVVIQFTNTVDFEGYNWTLSEIMYDRILDIVQLKAQSK